MSDVIIFAMGVIVTLFVSGAVGLLLWGAAQQPADGEVLEEHQWSPANSPARDDARERSRSDHAA